MKRMRRLLIGAAFLVCLAGLALGQSMLQKVAAAQAQNTVQAPKFEVDPTFPKPLPNGWYPG
jgi:hypothetical protein